MPGGVPEPQGAAPAVGPQAGAPADQVAPQGAAPAPQQAVPGATQPGAPESQTLPQNGGAAVDPKAQGGAQTDPKTQPAPGRSDQPGADFRPELLIPQLSDLLRPQVAQPGQAEPGTAAAPEASQPAAPGPVQPGKTQPASDSRVLPATIPGASDLPGGIHPIAAPIAPKSPPVAAPQLPGAGTQSNPGIRTSPGTLPNPGTQSPSTTDKSSKTGEVLDIESMSTLVQSAVKMMGPLAKMLMGQNGVASDLVNLAYSLVSVLSSTILTAPAK